MFEVMQGQVKGKTISNLIITWLCCDGGGGGGGCPAAADICCGACPI